MMGFPGGMELFVILLIVLILFGGGFYLVQSGRAKRQGEEYTLAQLPADVVQFLKGLADSGEEVEVPPSPSDEPVPSIDELVLAIAALEVPAAASQQAPSDTTIVFDPEVAAIFADEAEELLAGSLDVHRRVLGDEHPDTPIAMNNLASVYMTSGRYAEAEALYVEALELFRRLLGSAGPVDHEGQDAGAQDQDRRHQGAAERGFSASAACKLSISRSFSCSITPAAMFLRISW